MAEQLSAQAVALALEETNHIHIQSVKIPFQRFSSGPAQVEDEEMRGNWLTWKKGH